MHFYQDGVNVIDELEVGLEAPPGRPVSLAAAAQRRLPQSKVGDYMLSPHPSVLPPVVRTTPPLCPAPKTDAPVGRVTRYSTSI